MTGEFPRDEFREVLRNAAVIVDGYGEPSAERVLDKFAALWPAPVPPHTIDRDALENAVDDIAEVTHRGQWSSDARRDGADRILALVQPAAVTLTAEERDRVTGWFVKLGEPPTDIQPEDRALFRKLEAAS